MAFREWVAGAYALAACALWVLSSAIKATIKLYKDSIGMSACCGIMQEKHKSSIREIAESIAYIVLGMVLAAAAYGILGAVLKTGNPVVTVVSDSMEPTLYRGDLLVLKGTNVGELAAGRPGGSIIVYLYPAAKKLIVHRVWKINPEGTLNTWGDNNASPDPWTVEPEWIRGKMILRVPYLGYPRLWLKDILGF